LIRQAVHRDSIKIASLLLESLNVNSVERHLRVDKMRLLDHVKAVIASDNGFARVALSDSNEIVGCYMGELKPHAYCVGYIAAQLGVYIHPDHRGSKDFILMFKSFIDWAESKPDVLFKSFTTSQMQPGLKKLLERHGFNKASEEYYRL